MAQLSNSAIIVIVLVACLAVTALGAAMFRQYNPREEEGRYNTSYEQGQYMRQVRMRNYGHLKQESLGATRRPPDLESRYTQDEAYDYGSGQYSPHTAYGAASPMTPATNH